MAAAPASGADTPAAASPGGERPAETPAVETTTPAPGEPVHQAAPAVETAAPAVAPAPSEPVQQAAPAAETTAPSEPVREAAPAPETTAPSESAPQAAPPPVETATPAPAEQAPQAAPIAEIDPVLAQVRQQLGAVKLTDSTSAERAALTAFYADRKAPVWVTAEGFTSRARDAMEEISKADDWGLSAAAFVLPTLGSGDNAPTALADAEIKLGVAVLKYARYARGGRLDPAQVSRNFDQKVTLRDPKVVLETVAGLDSPAGYLRSLHPSHRQFQLLRQALLKVRASASQPESKEEPVLQLPEGPVLKLGMEHRDVALLRERLKLTAEPGAEDLYDKQVQQAVTDYQRKNGMKADGVLGARTRAALNGADKPTPAFGSEEQRLIVNMERWRWMPEDMGELHVWDNVPEFMTRVVRKGTVIHQAKIVVGRVDTQTTIFSANMHYIVFGPEWGVPDSIKVKELLPYLRPTAETGGGFFGFGGGGTVTDTRILEKHNLRVSYNGQPVDPSQIDFSQVDIRRYSFIQPSGPTNALGAVKFRFPNKHDIYMHDTPQRELFDRSVRAFSHGCVRVQNPSRFAEVLLEEDKGWSSGRVRDLMERGGNNEVTLTRQIPVHITYFTTVASEDGQVHSFPDIYGHDKRVAMALAGRPMSLEPPSTTNVEGLPTAKQDTKPDMKEARRPRRYDQNNEDLFSALFGN